MSLVCYGSSDSEEESEEQIAIIKSGEQSVPAAEEKNTSRFDCEEKSVLDFNSIPKPVPTKGRATVKITIPSLDQFKEDDIKMELKAKPTFKGGSGLLSMLPPPKYTGSTTQSCLTPHILTKLKNAGKKAEDIKSMPKKSTTKSIKSASVSKVQATSENISKNNVDEDDDSDSVDFFSLESVNKKNETNEKHELDTQLPSKRSLFSSLPEPVQNISHTATPIYQEEATTKSEPFTSYSSVQSENSPGEFGWSESYPSTHSGQADWSENCQSVQNSEQQTSAEAQFLEDEKFKKMLGRKKENIRIIDVNADDQLTGKDQWLMQSLTEEKVHRPSKRRGDMPTQQQKRKHQITYLAFQAKEREMDLKNQWSLNSRTRRETQAKYGF